MKNLYCTEEFKNLKIEDEIQIIIEQENFDDKIPFYAKYKDVSGEKLKTEIKDSILKKYQLSEHKENLILKYLLNLIKKYKEIIRD